MKLVRRAVFVSAATEHHGGDNRPGQVLPIRGLSPEKSRLANRVLRRGEGIRIQPARTVEARQMHCDHFTVRDRSRAYAGAVLALLQARV